MLSAAEARGYQAARRQVVRERYRVEILGMDSRLIGEIGAGLLTGSVSCDVTRDVTTTLRLSLDTAGRSRLGGDSPALSLLRLDRMVRVWVDIESPSLPGGVELPLFTGPIVRPVADEGSTLTIEAHGKEALGLTEAWRKTTFRKGARKTDVITEVLTEYLGERPCSMRIPDRPDRLPQNLTIGREGQPWKAAQRLARSMGCVLYYDALGVAVMRRRPRHVSAVDAIGERGTILEPPRRSFDSTEIVNAVRVIGHDFEDACREPVRATAVAPARHPLSPQRLGQNAAERYLPRIIDEPDIRTQREAQHRADEVLAEGLRRGLEVDYAAVPDHTIQPYELRRVVTGSGSTTTRVRSYELPLGPGRMTVGYRDARPSSPIWRRS